MIYIQILFNLIFIIGLITATVSGFNLWRLSRSFAKRLQKYLPKHYSQRFLDLANPNKYKNLNEDIKDLINSSENNKDFLSLKKQAKIIQEKHFLKGTFEEFIISEIESFKKDILFWKKLGNFAVWSSLVGAAGSILFLIFKVN